MSTTNSNINIAQSIKQIRQWLGQVNDFAWDMFTNPNNIDEEEKALARERMNDTWRMTISLCEQLQLSSLLNITKSEVAKYVNNPWKSKWAEKAAEPYLIWPSRLERIIHIIECLFIAEIEGFKTNIQRDLVQVLHSSEGYITSNIFQNLPSCEDDIHRRIEAMLRCCYDNVLTKPPIPRQIKNFMADTGIPYTKSLIEYKFIESQGDAKIVVGQILSDVGGYDSPDYDNLIFVIYETARFVSEQDWNSAIKSSNHNIPVQVVLLKGLPATQSKGANAKSRRRPDRPNLTSEPDEDTEELV